jgi:hypothetical protein
MVITAYKQNSRAGVMVQVNRLGWLAGLAMSGLLLLVPLPLLAEALEAERQQVWKELVPRLDRALTLEERHDSLPDRAWLSADKPSNQRSINELLDQTVTLLADVSVRNYREQIREREQAIRTARDEIARYRLQRISAPQQSWWQKTTDDYQQAMVEAEQRITRLQADIVQIRRAFATQLQDYGLHLDDEQLEFLLSTVTGDALIDLGVAFDNVKVMVYQLEDLLIESGEDLNAARRYYGMYAILLEALLRMHEGVLENVVEYQQRLEQITERTRTLMGESRRLSRVDERHRAVLSANLEAQQLALRSARLYSEYLREQANAVVQSQRQLQHDLAVARNTYETVRVSGELVQMLQVGQHMLDDLLARQVPALFSFRNLELRREFEQLTLKLRQE